MLPNRAFGNDERSAVPTGTAEGLSIVIIVSAPSITSRELLARQAFT